MWTMKHELAGDPAEFKGATCAQTLLIAEAHELKLVAPVFGTVLLQTSSTDCEEWSLP